MPYSQSIDALLAKLNSEQRKAAMHGEGPLLIVAGAGTGKTTTLVHRVAWLIAQGIDPSRILLLTFTRRAAAEMLRRVDSLVRQLAILPSPDLPSVGAQRGVGGEGSEDDDLLSPLAVPTVEVTNPLANNPRHPPSSHTPLPKGEGGVRTSRIWGGTFHAIATRLLRRYGKSIGLPPEFSVHDRTDSEDLLNVVRTELNLAKTDKRFPKRERAWISTAVA